MAEVNVTHIPAPSGMPSLYSAPLRCLGGIPLQPRVHTWLGSEAREAFLLLPSPAVLPSAHLGPQRGPALPPRDPGVSSALSPYESKLVFSGRGSGCCS